MGKSLDCECFGQAIWLSRPAAWVPPGGTHASTRSTVFLRMNRRFICPVSAIPVPLHAFITCHRTRTCGRSRVTDRLMPRAWQRISGFVPHHARGRTSSVASSPSPAAAQPHHGIRSHHTAHLPVPAQCDSHDQISVYTNLKYIYQDVNRWYYLFFRKRHACSEECIPCRSAAGILA